MKHVIKRKFVGIRLPFNVANDLAKQANLERRSLSNYIEQLLADGLRVREMAKEKAS